MEGPTWRNIKQYWKVTLTHMGVFDLGKTMFVMECLSYVLANAYKSGIMDVKSDNGKVGTEVTRKNMSLFVT